MYERFTDPARRLMELARCEADRHGSGSIQTVHILMGLAKLDCGFARHFLRNLGIELEAIRQEAERLASVQVDFPKITRVVIEKAIEEAESQPHRPPVGTELILVALVRVEQECNTAPVLTNLGLTLPALREEINRNLFVKNSKKIGEQE